MRPTMRAPAPALYVPVVRRGPSGAPMLRNAYFGLRLVAVAGLSHESRVEAQTLLLSRFGSMAPALPGAGRALDLRYVVHPASADNDWTEAVECLLLARISVWADTPLQVRQQAVAFAATLQDLLAATLPAYAFEPLISAREVAAALLPFPPADLVEVRRRSLELADGSSVSLPLLGIPDADALIELMLRQPQPSMLVCCIAPAEVGPLPSVLAPGELILASLGNSGNLGKWGRHQDAARQPRQHDTDADALAVSGALRDLPYVQWSAQRASALRMAAFRLRLQIVGAGQLSDALVASVARETGGPGRLTAGAAWRDPGLPLAGGADCSRPRSARQPGARATETAIAVANVRTLEFAKSQPTANPTPDLAELADLREAACLFPLPVAAPYLPAQSAILPLPFRAPAVSGTRLGVNRVRGLPRPVNCSIESRNHHLWVVGTTGAGKTTLLESMILQDIHAGRGVIAIDPHGDLIGQLCGKIPARRVRDVILLDPADRARPLGLNPLEVVGEDAQAQTVSDFIGLLIKLYDPLHTGIIGPRFEHNARNVMLTVMATPGNTLVEVLRAFQDDNFVTHQLLPHVTDPLVRRYWEQEIRSTNDFHRSEVLNWLVSKFSHFVTDPTMRRILGQSRSSFSFFEAMNSGKIVLISLAKGLLGHENATFLGLILLPMVLHAALARAEIPEAQRRDTALYVDEFQNYATSSLALMLAEARKYHLGLTLANQHVGQLTPEIRDAVIGNVGSLIAFRLGVADAGAVEAMLAPSPVAGEHLVSLPNFAAYGRLLLNGQRTPAFALETERVPYAYSVARAAAVRQRARMTYGRPREEVDQEINARAHMLDEPARVRLARVSLP